MTAMTPPTEAAEGIYRVCDALNLEEATRRGWRLCFAYTESVATPVYNQVPNTNPATSYQAFSSVQDHIATSVTRFLMKISEESVLISLSNELGEAHRKTREASAAKEAAEKRAELTQVGNDSLREQVEDLNTQLRQKSECIRTGADAHLRLEKDLAKIRTAVGELRMKEILGS